MEDFDLGTSSKQFFWTLLNTELSDIDQLRKEELISQNKQRARYMSLLILVLRRINGIWHSPLTCATSSSVCTDKSAAREWNKGKKTISLSPWNSKKEIWHRSKDILEIWMSCTCINNILIKVTVYHSNGSWCIEVDPKPRLCNRRTSTYKILICPNGFQYSKTLDIDNQAAKALLWLVANCTDDSPLNEKISEVHLTAIQQRLGAQRHHKLIVKIRRSKCKKWSKPAKLYRKSCLT